ncbi:MAG: thiamine ABC transporter substrate binding subunit [Paracoccaceae bacterium]
MKQPIIIAGILALATSVAAQDNPVLTILTYDSFVSDWGPGPQVKAAFEATCDCELNFVASGDGAALLARLRLEGARTDVDIVLGLDTNLTAAAAETGLFEPHGISGIDFNLPIDWDDALFLPYDWGYFAFVYDKETVSNPPTSLKSLADSDLKIVIQDPRSSTPGLGLLLWTKAAYGDGSGEIWQGLSDNIVTVTKGWSEAYGMFLEGEADMVLSYTTSPAYHLIAEADDSKSAAMFDEGHYMQIEVAAKVASTDQPELVDQFLQFMVSDAFQSIIPTTNWMYPAVLPDAGLPDGFETLIQPEISLVFSSEQAIGARDAALTEWLTILSQ